MNAPLTTNPTNLFDDVIRLPIREELATLNGIQTQGYALLLGDKTLLIDAVDDLHLDLIDELIREGTRPAALVLTHKHLTEYSSGLRALHVDRGVPVFMHPLDAEAPRPRESGVRFEDPTESALLKELGLTVVPFPGHTPGCIVVFWGAHGGVLFTGDSAVGPRLEDRLAGGDTAIRPPLYLSESDELLRRSWAAFDRPIAHILPLHGEPFIGRPIPSLLASLRREEQSPEFEHKP